jgi:phosphomannomutase/phosphoglucomutase
MRKYASSKGYETIELDGVRMEFEKGWALVRFSNTSPNLTVIIEANDDDSLKAIEDEILTKVKQYIEEVKE